LSALVAAVALVLNGLSDQGSSTPRTVGSLDGSGTPLVSSVSPTSGPQQFSSAGSIERDVAIRAISFVGPDAQGPAFEFRGTAEVRPDDAVRVVARRTGADRTNEESWITSPAVEVAEDRTWRTRIGRPPLNDGAFEFAAVVIPRVRGGTGVSGPAVQSFGVPCHGDAASLELKGTKACPVVTATDVGRYEP
jgi:hypothetical protein